MKKVDYMVVGGGIAGLLTTFCLVQSGRSVCLFHDDFEQGASRLSGAVLNPVNLKNGRPAFSGNALATAVKTYQTLEQYLDTPLLYRRKLIYLFEPPDTGRSWLLPLAGETVHAIRDCFSERSMFQSLDVWQLDNRSLFTAWQRYRSRLLLFRQGVFVHNRCSITPHEIRYEHIVSKAIIFCEGAQGRHNPFFQKLPFLKNRGDILFLSIPQLPADYIYQLSHRLIPLGKGRFWMGSNYRWNFDDLTPDQKWRKHALSSLQLRLKLPFTLIDHVTAERPTTSGQQPIIIQHPTHKNLYCLNGLGTKGFSLGPDYCHELLKLLGTSATIH